MKKYSCLILDDNLFFQKILEELIDGQEDLVLQSAINSNEALRFSNISADVIFFDPTFIGMSASDLLKQLNYEPQLVIISSNDKLAPEVFQNHVVDLLDKSTLTVDRFEQSVDKIKSSSFPASISA